VNSQEREQFREFMTSRWPDLVRLAYGLTGDRWLAEDLAQTALASACTAWWRVRRADDPDAYVRKILINASKRRFRRAGPAEQTQQALQAQNARIDDQAALSDQRTDLLTALRALPQRQRAVIVLKYWADMNDAQIADLLGCSEGTVRSQAWRALAKLRVSDALMNGEAR
jgi:RNA polymerase sigma-70 factor (sigma-E family)